MFNRDPRIRFKAASDDGGYYVPPHILKERRLRRQHPDLMEKWKKVLDAPVDSTALDKARVEYQFLLKLLWDYDNDNEGDRHGR